MEWRFRGVKRYLSAETWFAELELTALVITMFHELTKQMGTELLPVLYRTFPLWFSAPTKFIGSSGFIMVSSIRSRRASQGIFNHHSSAFEGCETTFLESPSLIACFWNSLCVSVLAPTMTLRCLSLTFQPKFMVWLNHFARTGGLRESSFSLHIFSS